MIILLSDAAILAFLFIVVLPFALIGENTGAMIKVMTIAAFIPSLAAGLVAYERYKHCIKHGVEVSGMAVKTLVIELMTAIATMIGAYYYLSNHSSLQEKPGFFSSILGGFGFLMFLLITIIIAGSNVKYITEYKITTPVKVAWTNVIRSAVTIFVLVFFF
ncbi:MAG: hypothetical protein IKQ90_01170 [Ruminococcus sp.]|nr:hypothetical protein [Ruminococcus sp.]